ncbi:hypothetical protein [Pseudomonas hunanensis]|uniref:hypothetical protein n=1 Tax=Pseudomonas hunanensis TaxID=1247546 RepID=UPI0024069503|nr:hypothetical protein [Pseudomonas hunanensis]MDF9756423.1 hypothetical protein [Pseudomonas hunanensis]
MDKYAITGIFAFLAALIAYAAKFHDSAISSDPAVWGQLGDYFGGLLNPALSFISLILLIKSLRLQNETNFDLRKEIKRNEKNESLQSFETLFFNMISSLQNNFNSFSINLPNLNNKKINSQEAVIAIETVIEDMREKSYSDEAITEYLEEVDATDKIFSATRSFYIIAKTIEDKLTNDKGFSKADRISYIVTLINFTDFSLLRLIMISMQFMKYESTNFLIKSENFNEALSEVGLKYDLY